MRRYTATQDELREYMELAQEIEKAKADLDNALKTVEGAQQAVASAEARLAEWDPAHGEDSPE